MNNQYYCQLPICYRLFFFVIEYSCAVLDTIKKVSKEKRPAVGLLVVEVGKIVMMW